MTYEAKHVETLGVADVTSLLETLVGVGVTSLLEMLVGVDVPLHVATMDGAAEFLETVGILPLTLDLAN